jgi:hypothetical protein
MFNYWGKKINSIKKNTKALLVPCKQANLAVRFWLEKGK